jgi:hypothetical protein
MPTDRPLQLRVGDAQPDTATEAELIGVLERFSSAFADRDAEAVLHLFAPTDASSWLRPRSPCCADRRS